MMQVTKAATNRHRKIPVLLIISATGRNEKAFWKNPERHES